MMTSSKIRIIYILLFMAFAMWRVFYNIYLEDIGLKGSEIGTINAVIQSSIFVVVILWGRMADKKGIRPTLKMAILGTALAMFILSYLQEFWVILLFIPIMTFFFHPLGPLNDAMAIQFSALEKKGSFGSFRLWGSLGWAVAAILGGFAFTLFPVKYSFYISTIFFLSIIPLLSIKRKKYTFTSKFEAYTLKDIFRNIPLVLFIGIITLYGVVCAPVNSYLNLYFSSLNSSNDTIGLAYAIMAFSEIPLFLVGNRLLQKLNAKKVMLIALCTMLVRFVLYGFFPNENLALLTGLLQGVSLAFFLVGAVDYIKGLIPPNQDATSQSIIWGAYMGIGQTLGNIAISYMIDDFGMVGMMKWWIIPSLFCVLLTYVYFIKYKYVIQKEK